MSASARGTAPPSLANFEFRELLGSGGYADVYLYEQQRPRRDVAVKVLLAEGLTEAGRRQFAAEADLMATLSAHPAIVTIYEADISPDGRPYLVMEFYPGADLRSRSRTERLPVAEVLRIGVQISSAIETAHRAGIVHRDIKPANILTSRYNKAGLTDFGISASTHESGDDIEGVSVPWAPPEAFDEQLVLDVRSDIYSLGATLFTLLTGRSPFEQPGGANSQLDLMSRIDRSAPPPTGRQDVPASLERLLAQCMAKSPAERPTSAFDLALSLQQIEVELHLAPTPIDVMGDGPERYRRDDARVAEDDDRTRIRGAVTIEAQAPLGSGEEDVRTRLRPATTGSVSQSSSVAPTSSAEDVQATRASPWVWVGAVLAVVALIGGVLFVSSRNASDVAANDQTGVEDVGPTEPLVSILPPTPTAVTAVRDGSGDVRLSWAATNGEAADSYVYWRTDGGEGADGVTAATTSTSVVVSGVEPDVTPCFVVVAVRAGVSSDVGEPACAEPPG